MRFHVSHLGWTVLCLACEYFLAVHDGAAQPVKALGTAVAEGWDDRFEALGLNGPVFAIATNGGSIYAGGIFTRAGEVVVHNIAHWDGANWHALGDGIHNQAGPAIVYALALTAEGKLYAGGQFTQAGNANANNIAVWNGNDWAQLGSEGARGTNSTVYALAARENAVYAGGIFTRAGSLLANGVARWEGGLWSRLGTTQANGVTGGAAYALAIDNDTLFAGGDFTNAGSVFAPTVALWNLTTGMWSALGQGVNGKVQGLSSGFDGGLAAGGTFSSANGVAANNIAKWDGTFWSGLGTGAGNGVTNEVRALAQSGDYLYVGGNLFEAGGEAVSGMARWDGKDWSSLGSGVEGVVHALAYEGNGAIIVGGQFTGTGGKPARNFGIWHEAGNAVRERASKQETKDFVLYQNYPNPLNPSTSIDFVLPQDEIVSLSIYDAAGREVASLLNERRAAGRHRVSLAVERLPNGVYFYRLQAGRNFAVKKLAVVR